MKVTRISDWELEDRLGMDHHPMVVMFSRIGENGSQPPREELQYLAASYPEARFFEVDLLENPSLVRKLGLQKRFTRLVLPITVVYVEGVEKARHVGSLLVGVVEQVLGPHPDPDLYEEGEE